MSDAQDNITIDISEPATPSTFPLIDQIKRYVEQFKPKVAILTPCYGSQCYVNYVTCLINTMSIFSQFGISLKVEFCRNDSLVSRARNNLIAKAMSDTSITHMMFIDNDITWQPMDILKLIVSDKSLVGGVYPIKHYDWDKLAENPGSVQQWIDAKNASQLKDLASNTDIVQQRMVRYNINHLSNTLEIKNNLARVRHLATGFMMIKREVIDKMSKAFPSTKYVDDVGFLHGEENDYAYALFDCGVEEGHYCSEDWMFCNRWSKMGGQVWIDVSVNLNHTGIEDFRGSFIATLV
jgi:hypothetical protein